MKRHEYAHLYTSLNLSPDQQSLLFAFLDEALDSMGERDGVSAYYVDAVNSVYRFVSGDLESHDEFDDEFTLSSISYDIDKIQGAVEAFERENALYANEFKARAVKLRELLKKALTQAQYELFMAAMTTLFRDRLYFSMNYISKYGQLELITDGAHVITKVSFVLALGVSYCALLSSCMDDRASE